jgi:hypothetical protein
MRTAQKSNAGINLPPKLEEESATERIQIVATERWTKRVDDWRRKHPDMPNRSKAIRLLVELALDAGDKGRR